MEEAEKFKEDDEKVRSLVESKNTLESYIANWRNALSDPSSKTNLSDDDKTSMTDALNNASKWVDENPSASKEEYDSKFKELEELIKPFAVKFYSGAGAAGAGAGAGGMPDMSAFMGPDGKPDMAKMAEMMGKMGYGGGSKNDDESGLDEDYKSSGPTVDEVD
jgi:heat shock protein 1/8